MGLDGKTNSFRQPSGNGLFALKVVWHVHNLSSRISRNKSEHHLESTKHSICCCPIILCVALSSSIVVYCRLCYSLILPAIYWGRTKSSVSLNFQLSFGIIVIYLCIWGFAKDVDHCGDNPTRLNFCGQPSKSI